MQCASQIRSLIAKGLVYLLAVAMVFTMMPLGSRSVSHAAGADLTLKTPEVVVSGTAVIGGDAYTKDNISKERSYTLAELKAMDETADNVLYSAKDSSDPFAKRLYRTSGVYLSSLLNGTGFNGETDKLAFWSNEKPSNRYVVQFDPEAQYKNGQISEPSTAEFKSRLTTTAFNETRYVYKNTLAGRADEEAVAEPMLAWALELSGDRDPETAGKDRGFMTLIVGQLPTTNIEDMNKNMYCKYIGSIIGGERVDYTALTVGNTIYSREDILMMKYAERSYTYMTQGGDRTDYVRGVPMSVLLADYDATDVVTFESADGFPVEATGKTVGELIDGNYMLGYMKGNDAASMTGIYDTAKNKPDIDGVLSLYGDGARPAKMVNKIQVSTSADYSDSPYKHISYTDTGYNIAAITGATLTVEGPAMKGTSAISVAQFESMVPNKCHYRGEYKDTRAGEEVTRTYEGVDLYHILYSLDKLDIETNGNEHNVLLKNRNRQTIASLTVEEIRQMSEAGKPAIIAYGTSYTKENGDEVIAPFVYDGGAGYNPELGNADGCLKFVYDRETYGGNENYTKFGNVAYIYVEENTAPGYKHTGDVYGTNKNKNYVLTITGDAIGREVNYTVGQLEEMVTYDGDGNIEADNPYGHRDEYSLANNSYWYVNEYEGLKLWSLLLSSGIDEALANDDNTPVTFTAADGYLGIDAFTTKQVADPDSFSFYEKNAADNNDGTYPGNESIKTEDNPDGDKLRTGYPLLVAYGVNKYPYVVNSGDPGYKQGLSNDGGPLRAIFGKKVYNHANGSNQAKYLEKVVVGSDTYHYATHAYHSDDVYKSLKNNKLTVTINMGAAEPVVKEYTIEDLEKLVYETGSNKKAYNKDARVKEFYEAGSWKYSDLYEGVNLHYFLNDVVQMTGTEGTVTFQGANADNKIEMPLDEVLAVTDGYNEKTGMGGLSPVIAYGKNGAPLVEDKNAAGYINKMTLGSGEYEKQFDVKNAGGPLELIFPRANAEAADTMGYVQNLVSIEIDLVPDKYAHTDPPYSDLANNTLKVSGPGTNLEGEKKFTVGDLESKQNLITTADYSILGQEGGVAKESRYRGLSLYDFLKSRNVGLKHNANGVTVTSSDGESYNFTLNEVMKDDYVNSITGANDLEIMLAYGSSSVTKEDLKDGKPLVKGKTPAEGYDADYGNSGGPLRLIVGQKDDGDVNGTKCLKDVVSITVSAGEVTSNNHSSSPVYQQYLNETLEIIAKDRTGRELHRRSITLEELESWNDLILVQEMMVEAADGVHLWEGLNLWQVLQKEIGAIPGANNPISVTVKSKDGYSQELIQGIGIDGLINGKVEGNTRVPVILGYARDTYPLVPGKKGVTTADGYVDGNNGGPLRTMVNNVSGLCVTETNQIIVVVGDGLPAEEYDFTVNGVENGALTVNQLRDIGAEVKEYTHSKGTDKVRGAYLGDILESLGVTNEYASLTLNAYDGFEAREESYQDIMLGTAIDQEYFVAYEVYDAESNKWVAIDDKDKNDDSISSAVRLYRNYNAGTDWRNRCTLISGVTVTLPKQFKTYMGSTVPNSLPMAGIRSLSMTENGDLWLGTYGGGAALRPVGENIFKTYNTSSNPPLKTATVSAVAADSEGGVWMSQNASYINPEGNSGVAYMRNGEVTYYRAADSPATIPSDYVQEIKIDGDGCVWFGSFGGVTKYDPDLGTWTTWDESDGLPAASVQRIEFDGTGGMWVGFYPNSDDPTGGTAPFIGGFCYMKNGEVTKSYVYESSPDNFTGKHRLGDVWVRDIAVDKNGGAWITASGSYAGMNNVGGTVWYVPSPGADAVKITGYNLVGQRYLSGADNSELRAVAVDPDGGLWFGTSADGLIYVKNPVLSDGKLNVTKVYNSDKGSWANDNPLLNNIYTVDFFGKTIYAGSSAGLATYEFDFENSIGTVNPSMGDMSKDECDLEITGAGVQKNAYFSIRGLKNAEGVVRQTKSYNWQNSVGTTGITEAEGVYMENLLKDVVGLKEKASTVKFISRDGWTTELPLDKLMAEDLQGNKPMLAWKEDGEKCDPKLIVGQYEEGQANKSLWARNVIRIVVNLEPAEIVRTIDVIAAIDEIDDDITLDSYDAINRARTLYERLDTDAKKARVSNYDKLLEAEAAYDGLRRDAVVAAGMELLDDISFRDYDFTEMMYMWIVYQKYENKLARAQTSDEAEALVQEIIQIIESTPTGLQKAENKLIIQEVDTKVSYNYNKLSWEKLPAADYYQVFRAVEGSDKYTRIATIDGGAKYPSCTDKKVKFRTGYTYKVRAAGTYDDERIYGEEIYTEVLTPDIKKPVLRSVKPGYKKATLRWNRVYGASGYRIYRATSVDGKYKLVKTIKKGSTVKWTNKRLGKKKTYFYKIKAYRTVSKVKHGTEFSNIIRVKTK